MNFPLKNWKPSGSCNSNDLLKPTTLLLTSGLEHAIEGFANPSSCKAAMNTMYLAMALTLQCRFEGGNFLPPALVSLTVGLVAELLDASGVSFLSILLTVPSSSSMAPRRVLHFLAHWNKTGES